MFGDSLAAAARRLRAPWWLALGAALLAIAVPATTQAARTITVCPHGCDFTTIGAAVAAAPPGATVNVSRGTYSENITIDKSLTIVGSGAGRTVISSAAGHEVVVAVTAGTVHLADFAVTGAGLAGSTGISNDAGATVTLDDVTVTQNGGASNEGIGGGILNDGTMTINNSRITDNSATRGSNGGGIGNNGTLTIKNSLISGNAATAFGGGILNNGTLTVINTTIRNNSVSTLHGSGGGLYNAGTATLRHVDILNNTASTAGAIFSATGAPITLVDVQARGNSAPQCDPATLC